MNYLELFFLLFTLVIFLIPYTRNYIMKKPLIGTISSSFILVFMSFFLNRWQMIANFFLFGLCLILFTFMTYNDNYKRFNISDKIFRRLAFICISITMMLNFLFPINNLKDFKGQYYVGTSTISVTDYNRENKDIKMGKFRNLSIRMFYPSYRSGEEKQKLIDNPLAFTETTKRRYGALLASLFTYVNEIETSSYYDVEAVEDEEFPLIIISHDWMEYPEYYYDLAQKIAADGYYVAVPNYTGNSPYAILKDSNIEFGNPRLLADGLSNSSYIRNVEKISRELDEDFHQVISGVLKLGKIKEERFSRIDLKNIGVIGSGISAKSALDTAYHTNVKAVIAYDPYVESKPSYFLKNKLEKESLILVSEEWLKSANTRYLIQILENGPIDNKKLYYIKDFNHKDFTLMSMISPLYKFNGTTKYSYDKSLDIRYNTTKAYFDYHLKKLNTNKHMIDLIEKYEDIREIMLR